MHFHKFPHPANFEFLSRFQAGRFTTRLGEYRLSVRESSSDVYHLKITGRGWRSNDSQVKLHFSKTKRKAVGNTRLVIGDDGSLQLESRDGGVLLKAKPGRLFGQCAESSVFEFVRQKGDQFYGLGEKWTGFEHSGKTTKFWNTDVWADFIAESYVNGNPAPDPAYVSIPYLILKRGNTYLGFFLDNPHATFVSTGLKATIADQMEAAPEGAEFAEAVVEGSKETETCFYLGAEQGQPNLYLLVGPSLPELTRKMQKLVGTTPRPPGWALGYHQCRWGYESEADLLELDARFREHGIPVDGLWLDIDYMEGYRVFTVAAKHFPHPSKALDGLSEKGRKVIPIIDPGVKYDPGYGVYERGREAGAFCLNPQGAEYIGLVWPGKTVFPDFSTEAGRRWWSSEVAEFARQGFPGAWLDMNDPSTGPVDNHPMLFDRGRKSHSSFHNQYGLGMAAATREGFLQARPNERPFLLSRSGCAGSQCCAAIWTGDNFSNYHHLRNSIPTTLNLALSGIPFNGPDVGGFGGDTTPELIRDWFKACFLFPFMRNHSLRDTRRQEPWAFDEETTGVLRRFIQLRYRFRTYLYQLFLEQERSGEAILRPLFYDHEDTAALPLGKVDDQFMVGPCILQAPFLEAGADSREVVLPGDKPWYELATGDWKEAGRRISVSSVMTDTPIFLRDHSIVPLARIAPEENGFHPDRADFHIFQSDDGVAQLHYQFDDGETFDYRRGRFSEIEIKARRIGYVVAITTKVHKDDCGVGSFTFSVPADIRKVTINGVPGQPCDPQGTAIGPHFKTFA